MPFIGQQYDPMRSRYNFTSFSMACIWALLFSTLSACNGTPVQDKNGPVAEIASEVAEVSPQEPPRVVTGAERLVGEVLRKVEGKRIAIVANQTSLLPNGTHLVDTLHALGIQIQKVFAPEHGFRGDHDAGAKVNSSVDSKTGLPLVSLYGSNKKPKASQLEDVDLVLFDIQDVGARFYTYISTMNYVMEACADLKKPFLVLDRPNPNGWYVEGPVLEKGLTSFVGMHPIPIVHGMTIGEYAQMVNGEGWLKDGIKCVLEVVTCENYNHSMQWADTRLPWVAPSPNLATEYAAYLYPVLCWFEGMPVSIGRGTDLAFQQFGSPWHEGYHYQLRRDSVMESEMASSFQYYGLEFAYTSFTPVSMPGKSAHPKFEGKECFGARPLNRVDGQSLFKAGIALLKNFEEETHNTNFSEPLFQPFFKKLAGSTELAAQIKKQMSDDEIFESWQGKLGRFKQIRRKYLLYEDFEG